MSKEGSSPPKTAGARTARMILMLGSLATKEISRKIQNAFDLDSDPLARLKQAQILVKELGHLKGAAMKLGQMLALEARDYLPDEVCQVLEQLQSNASFMDYKMVAAIIERELGEKRKDFTYLSETPLAAASIGQVHRATLNERDVVLKIQYPGIHESIHSDIKVLGKVLKAVAGLMKKQVELDGILDEFADIFSQESDYLQEAVFLERYRECARGLKNIIVPEAIQNYSTAKILCMSYETGLTLPNWMRTDPHDLDKRKYYGQLILDIYTREFCDWGLVQTDPNLGNFLIRPEQNEIVLLDFGATKAYDLKFRKKYSELVVAVLSRSEKELMTIAEEMLLIDPRESIEAKKIFRDLMFESMHPITLPEYDFRDQTYVENMRKHSKALVVALKYSPPPKTLIFLHRKLGGIFQMLRILKVSLDLRGYTTRFEELAKSAIS
jgi:aarF domain-containing kinase